MPTWPAELPQSPLLEGWREDLPDLSYKFQPRTGKAIKRVKETVKFAVMQLSFLMTKEQYLDYFQPFYYDDCGGGAIDFEWVHPVSEETYDFQWVDTPQAVRAGLKYRISFALMRTS